MSLDLNIIFSGLTGCTCHLCTPNINYTIISNESLNPLSNDGIFYNINFGTICPGEIIYKTVTICNFTSEDFNFCGTYQNTNDFIFPQLSGETIPASNCNQINIYFSGLTNGYKETEWVGIPNSGCCVNIRAIGEIGNILTVPTGCTINFDSVSAGNNISGYFNITSTELGGTDIYISGDSSDFIFNRYHTINGTTSIPVIFSPGLPYEDKTTTLIISGGCSLHEFNLCGNSVFTGGVYSSSATGSTFVGCCTDVTITIYNNQLLTDYITITDIQYFNSDVTTEITTPFTISKADCEDVIFEFCPTSSGNTIVGVIIDYQYIYNNVTYTGQTTSTLDLTGYIHPFNLINFGGGCFNYFCYSGNSGNTITLVNTSPNDIELYYYVKPDNGYNIVDFIDLDPDNHIIISGNSSETINFDLYPWLLTTATTFNHQFELIFVDPECCIYRTKCIDISFCEITTSDNYGYPQNISCYNGNDGAISFTINGCNNQTYDVVWSSSTQQLPYTSTTVTGLSADAYTIKITDECNVDYYKSVVLTQPEPLFASISTINPNNYCKDNLPELCGIIDDNSPPPPSGYVVINKETIVRVVNNDIHNIPGQRKTGFQGADPITNQVAKGRQVDANNAFKNYILDYTAGAFERYKQKKVLEEIVTVKKWEEIIAETIGNGCCYVSFVSGGTAPYTYSWTGPDGFTSNSPNLFDIPCCDPYTLTIIDANGCTLTTSGACSICSFGVSDLEIIKPTCPYNEDGQIYVEVTGNCSNYGSVLGGLSGQYIISLESNYWIESYTGTSATFDDLGVDNYILIIEDIETGCLSNPIKITLTPYVEFTVSTSSIGTSCLESCDGSISVDAKLISTTPICSGYTVNNHFLYKLNDGEFVTGSTFTDLCSGNHTITVKDLCTGCKRIKSIKVPNLKLFNIETSTIDASSNNNSDGQITITVNNGESVCLPNECYVVNGETKRFNNNNLIINNLSPGEYTFTIVDNKNCISINKVIVGYRSGRSDKGFSVDTKSTGLYGGFGVKGNTSKGQ